MSDTSSTFLFSNPKRYFINYLFQGKMTDTMDDNIPLTSAAPPVVRIIYKITAYINKNTVIHYTVSCYIICGLSFTVITFDYLRDLHTGELEVILRLIEVDIIMIYSAIYSELHVTILFESS